MLVHAGVDGLAVAANAGLVVEIPDAAEFLVFFEADDVEVFEVVGLFEGVDDAGA